MEETERIQAKQYAMSDIGLTEDEANEAVNRYYPQMERFCQECGTELDEGKNCKDQFLDDFCNTCWGKFEEGWKAGLNV